MGECILLSLIQQRSFKGKICSYFTLSDTLSDYFANACVTSEVKAVGDGPAGQAMAEPEFAISQSN